MIAASGKEMVLRISRLCEDFNKLGGVMILGLKFYLAEL
jgi:hypothetical protein